MSQQSVRSEFKIFGVSTKPVFNVLQRKDGGDDGTSNRNPSKWSIKPILVLVALLVNSRDRWLCY